MKSYWTTKMGRYTIIAITYIIMMFLLTLVSMVPLLLKTDAAIDKYFGYLFVVFAVLGAPAAFKAVNWISDAIMGNLFMVGPMSMFVNIFLVKIAGGIILAVLSGPFVSPYTLGSFIADRIGAE